MERLTFRKTNTDFDKQYGRQARVPLNEIVDRLAELEDKLESGQLVEMPCKVGGELFIICTCKDIAQIFEHDTGASYCPFGEQCDREDCDCQDDNHLQIFKTLVGDIGFDNDLFELYAFAENTNLEIKIGENAFYNKIEAEARLKELQGK